jgi:LuxR family maltose regulon positive regulatory protein
MSAPLLATKLHVPKPRRDAIARPRLLARLDAGLHRKLTLLSAPAGFGKSSLVAAWLGAGDRSVAWLSLDEGDSDPARFLSYLIAALRSLAVPLGGSLLTAEFEGGPPTEVALTALLNALHGGEDEHVLVLDDLHLVDAAEVDRTLTFLIDFLPPQLHLVIATREDPPLPLARLRARDQVTEVREADLRFTRHETAAFFERVEGLGLSEGEVAALDARTEGWAAGLQLALLSLRGRDDPHAFLSTFTGSHRFVVDYLVEEVLLGQTDEVQRFLLRTSILERLSGELCDAVVAGGLGVGRERLAHLERTNLLLVPLDDERRWYRYHHLFAEVLRARLAQQLPDELPELHRRAGAWFVARGFPDEAVGHALASGDSEWVAAIVEGAWSVMHDEHRYATVLGWLLALPDDAVRRRARLGVAAGWSVLMLGRLEEVEPWLQAAENAPADAVEEASAAGSLRVSVAAARTYLAQALGDLPGTVRYAREVLEHAGPGDEGWTGAAATLLGLAEWIGGDLVAAEGTLSASYDALLSRGELADAIGVTFVLADVRTALGRLRAAADAYEASLRLVDRREGQPSPDVADLYRGYAELRCERGDFEGAERHLQRARELAESGVLPDWQYRFARTEARLAWANGDLEGALALFEAAERQQVRTALPDVRPVSAWRARALVALGRWREAWAWVRERGLAASDDLIYAAEFEHLTLARVLLARYAAERGAALDDAVGLLERLLAAAEGGSRVGSVIEARMLLALAYRARGASAAAHDALTAALGAAEPESYVRLFLDEGPPMERLLATVAAQGILPVYVGALRAGFVAAGAEAARAASAAGRSPGGPALEELLTERELEVLRLIADGRSNREIAELLSLALNTVKSYNRNIFGKLLVERRTEAVARARELGLL